jgi:putative endonuclease
MALFTLASPAISLHARTSTKSNAVPGFTRRYHVHLLVWFECYDDPLNAIAREKEIKKWRRDWKINLIERTNPEWVDLYESIAQ